MSVINDCTGDCPRHFDVRGMPRTYFDVRGMPRTYFDVRGMPRTTQFR